MWYMKLTGLLYRAKCLCRTLDAPEWRNKFHWDIELHSGRSREEKPLINVNLKGDYTCKVWRAVLVLAASTMVLSTTARLCRLFRK